jgi:hypothetical protein
MRPPPSNNHILFARDSGQLPAEQQIEEPDQKEEPRDAAEDDAGGGANGTAIKIHGGDARRASTP